MTMTQQDIDTALRNAIRAGLEASHDADGSDLDRDTTILTHVKNTLNTLIPALVDAAMREGAAINAMTTEFVIPMLATLEDEINDDHDDPKTDAMYRPGLRRAARLIRETRRAATKDTK